MNDRPPVSFSGTTCYRCGSDLTNAEDGWPTPNESGCRDSYHDGGFGSRKAPGFCGVHNAQWFRVPPPDAPLTERIQLHERIEQQVEEQFGRVLDRELARLRSGLIAEMTLVAIDITEAELKRTR